MPRLSSGQGRRVAFVDWLLPPSAPGPVQLRCAPSVSCAASRLRKGWWAACWANIASPSLPAGSVERPPHAVREHLSGVRLLRLLPRELPGRFGGYGLLLSYSC